MNRILYVTKHNPWGIGGGSYASRMYLNAFSKYFKDSIIDLCVADNCACNEDLPKNIFLHNVPPRSHLSRVLSPCSGILHRYQDYALKLLNKGRYDLVIFDHSSIAGSLVKFLPSHTRSIVIHHNFEVDYFHDNTPSFIQRLLIGRVVGKCERAAFQNCDINIFLTNEDLGQCIAAYSDNKGINIVTGLVEDNSQPTEAKSSIQTNHPTIAITGSLDNVQNVDGIEYFINCLLPLVPSDYKIIIAGKNPTKEIYDLLDGYDNIELIPSPSDMSEIIKNGTVYLSPARLGSGIKVRISDGFRHGLPVIAHTTSSRGYGEMVQKGYMYSFNTPQEFHHALIDMVTRIERGEISSEDIVKYYKKTTSFNSFATKLTQALDSSYFYDLSSEN